MAKREIELTRAYRLLEPGPVVLVTAQYRGKKNLMAAAWVTPVSLSPPRVALAVFPERYTHDMIVKGGDFVLNIPARPLAEKVQKAGEVSGQDQDKFLLTGLTPVAAKAVNAPLVAECLAHLECGLNEVVSAGDHSLLLGDVIAASAEESAFDGEYWTLADESVTPLNHLGKNVYALMGARFVV